MATGKLPYAHRTNDPAVIVDVIRGVRPTMEGTSLLKLDPAGDIAFGDLLRRCWAEDPAARPCMAEVTLLLDVLNATQAGRLRDSY